MFEQAVEIVLEFEGEGQPQGDPGGLTRWGISQRAYPTMDLSTLTREDAKVLYKREYWDPVQGDRLPWPLSLVVFDTAVNHGVGTAIRLLQRAVMAPTDGIMGPRTLTNARSMDPKRVILDLLSFRGVLYDLNPADHRGWYRRLCALAWTSGVAAHHCPADVSLQWGPGSRP